MTRAGGAVWVIAHRGASKDCPENTLAAFDEGLRRGADGIELDVQLSRDGVPVVFHDRTLVRAGGGRRRVHRLDAEALAALDPGARFDSRFRGEHIPTLEEVLLRYGRKTRLLVEIKTREGAGGKVRHERLGGTVARMIAKNRLEASVMILSFDDAVLAACACAAPSVPRVLNLKPPRSLGARLRERLRTFAALSVDVRTLTPGFAAQVRTAGLPLFAYTCNTPRRVDRATAAGVRGVMSDRPGWLAGYLQRREGAGGA